MGRSWKQSDIARLRLHAQEILTAAERDPAAAVDAMTAMQGQDLPGTLWAIGLRTGARTEADVRDAFDTGAIVRSWPMRGTLHALTPGTLRMILPLSRDRLVTSLRARHRELGITASDIADAARAAEAGLSTGSGRLSRTELFAVFEAAGQPTAGQRGSHVAFMLAQSGLLCLGPFIGKEQAFVLLDDWAPMTTTVPDRDEALATVALRYFRSHGPATVADFAWWARLTLTDARSSAAAISDQLSVIDVDGTDYFVAPEVIENTPLAKPSVRVLPGFDELLLGYTDRSAVLDPRHSALIVPGNNGVFKATVVVNGHVVGTWLRRDRAKAVDVTAQLFQQLSPTQERDLVAAFEQYGTFRGKPVELKVVSLETSGAH
ncbi:winged helix DNA-binding domain-containing protein [Mycetocola zhujimingii]|uniref:Winged helix DNA-binding domain-containing protein n=1 Tax=Mycetocola zhujimingii TaxID=2079792 RepID=A0A2U1TGZ7_9MICO|nr:winged helix DNA-binding domain-containing protein [Mycetocola zhujimingii]AWB86631.1 hypothetical protein C3E77_08365 [Mycetocola zhujimingii]PWC08171.1 winged helix DNA-binding domain-containing protein [Mycetocola zhujimingii]